MASLINTKIKDTYEGLIKTLDNLALTGTAKGITDGGGNPTNITMSTTSTNFPSGTVDFTGATVTGDNNTTYVLNSVQDGSNADIKLTDADGNDSKVTLVAGTNITLSNLGNDLTINAAADTNTTYSLGSTQDGSNADIVLTDQLGNTSKATLVAGTNITLSNTGNDLTITAAGGSAGLEVGTGTDSLQNAVGTASTASGAASIAIGKNATASASQSMAYGEEAQATQVSSAAFGQYAEATNFYAIAFGRTSSASGDGSVAFGQQTSAAQAGAVAMGRQVTSDTADTTHVRALKIVAPDGGTGGNGITMLSPDGTAYVLTVSNAGALVIT